MRRIFSCFLLLIFFLVRPAFAGDYLGYSRTEAGELPLPKQISGLNPQLLLNLNWGRFTGWQQPVEIMPIQFNQQASYDMLQRQLIQQQLQQSLQDSQRIRTNQPGIARWQLFSEVLAQPANKPQKWYCQIGTCQGQAQPAKGKLLLRFWLKEKALAKTKKHPEHQQAENIFEQIYQVNLPQDLQLLLAKPHYLVDWLNQPQGQQFQIAFNLMAWDLLQAMAPMGEYIPIYQVKNETLYLDAAPRRLKSGQMLTALHQPRDIGLDNRVVNSGPAYAIGYVKVIESGQQIVAEPLDFRADMMRPGDHLLDPGPWFKPMFARSGAIAPMGSQLKGNKETFKTQPAAVPGKKAAPELAQMVNPKVIYLPNGQQLSLKN